jgi:hypothetical protein
MHNFKTFITVLVILPTVMSGCLNDETSTSDTDGSPTSQVLFGFVPFPYDLTLEAINKVHEVILPNSNLYVRHGDGCLPWEQTLSGEPFPEWLIDDWNDTLERIPDTHTVYISVTPTDVERVNLAPACGEDESTPADIPEELKGARFNDPLVKEAYLNYVRRAVEHFNPSYINIGIEISELALREPEKWPEFEELYDFVFSEIKAESPGIKIGAEFVLQSLLLPRVADMVKPLVERSDYVGISFYPYGSEFGEFFGAPPLPDPPAQWQEPLAWLRTYTDKPVAIAETGYTTKNQIVGEITFPGNEALQKDFLEDLVKFAKEDNYIFVVWFVPVDYERLLEKLPGHPETSLIWVNAGLFDANVQPKPAWEEWQKFAEP